MYKPQSKSAIEGLEDDYEIDLDSIWSTYLTE